MFRHLGKLQLREFELDIAQVDAHRLLRSIKKIDNDMSHCEKPLPNELIFHSMRFEETFGMISSEIFCRISLQIDREFIQHLQMIKDSSRPCDGMSIQLIYMICRRRSL